MDSKKIGLFFVFTIINSSWANEPDFDVLCSKALLQEMSDEKLISNNDSGVCIQDLNDLPTVSIGLGTEAYPTGKAATRLNAKVQKDLHTVSEILTSKKLSEIPFSLVGYADGQNNDMGDYSLVFLADLGNKRTFNRGDIIKFIKDEPTKKKILELLKRFPEKTEFSIDDTNDTIKRVMSLARNYYLAMDRAQRTCEQLLPFDIKDKVQYEKDQEKCNSSISGHASPLSEVIDNGNNNCSARRKSVLVLNSSVNTSQHSNPSEVQPRFQIPRGTAVRDMQMASTLNLFKQISKGDPYQVIEKIAQDCTGGQTNTQAFDYNKQNLLRMYDDINSLASSSDDPALKQAIYAGNYKEVKRLIEPILDSKDHKNYKIAETIVNGFDRDGAKARAGFIEYDVDKNKYGKILNCTSYEKLTDPVHVHEFKSLKKINFADGETRDFFECIQKDGRTYYLAGKFETDPPLSSLDKEKKLANSLLESSNWIKRIDNKFSPGSWNPSYKVVDTKYPFASRSPSNTDIFNCLSPSAAIGEKMQSVDSGDAGHFIETDKLVPDANGKITAKINEASITSHKKKNVDTESEKGWICEKCHNGLKIKTVDEKSIPVKTSREVIFKDASSSANEKTPMSEMGLTFGSMKNLGYRKVTRDSFGSSCPEGKSVCDCLKQAGQTEGDLDEILKKSIVVNLNSLKGEFNFSNSDKSNSCLWAPPVSPSCIVQPNGKSSERTNILAESLNCKALDRFFAKYNKRNPVKDPTDPNKETKLIEYLNKFSSKDLNKLQCKNVFPNEDDTKDCPTSSGGSSTSGAKAKAE